MSKMDDTSTSTSIKTIIMPLPSSSHRKKHTKASQPQIQPKKLRCITNTNSWKTQFDEHDFTVEKQLEMLNCLLLSHMDTDTTTIATTITISPKIKLMASQIKRKLDGYRNQDIEKNKFDPIAFVDLSFVVDQLVKSNLQCFYCKQQVSVLYHTVRDPKQWTLERVYNNQGHNKKNIEIACLSCNIKRRTMYHEKYRFTKQICFEKEVESESNTQSTDSST